MSKLFNLIRRVKINEYIILALIVISAFGVRLYKISTPLADWHSWRQSDTASVSRIYVDVGIDLLLPRYYDISAIQTGQYNPEGYRFVEFPIFNAIHAYVYQNVPLPFISVNQFEVWGRLVSIFCTLIITVFLYFLGRRWFGKEGGFLSAAFYAFLPYNIYFTRVILPEPMTAMFAVIALYCFVQFIDSDKSTWLFASATAFAFAMLLKPYIAFYGVPMLYLAIKKYGIKGIFKNYRLLIAFDIILIPFFLWRGWVNQHPEGIPFYNWAFNGDNIRFRPSFWNWIFGERIGRLILGTWGLVPFALGLLILNKDKIEKTKPMLAKNWKQKVANFFYNDKDYNWVLQFTALGGFIYLVLVATANVRHDYYQAILVPIICFVLANGTLFMWRSPVFPKLLSRSILLLSLSVMMIVSAIQVREFYKVNHPEIIEAGQAIDRIAPKDALVIAPYNGDSAFLYQTRRFGWPFVDRPIRELIQDGADYWVSVNYGDPQTVQVMREYTIVEQKPSYVIVDLNKKK